MATYPIVPPARLAQEGAPAPADPNRSLIACILAGFGMFGLAAGGTSFAILTSPHPSAPQYDPSNEKRDEL